MTVGSFHIFDGIVTFELANFRKVQRAPTRFGVVSDIDASVKDVWALACGPWCVGPGVRALA